jgi:hypothetical protein
LIELEGKVLRDIQLGEIKTEDARASFDPYPA